MGFRIIRVFSTFVFA